MRNAGSLDLLLAAAVPTELHPFVTRLGVSAPRPGGVRTVVGERSLALLAAGVGRQGDGPFAAAVRELRPTAVVNIGIAGALDPGLAAGTVVVVSEWRHRSPPHQRLETADVRLRESLAAGLDAARLPWLSAPAVTIDRALHDARARDLLRQTSGARIVEMEGAAWASLARADGVPFAALRVISDHADRPLPGQQRGRFKRDWMLKLDGSPRRARWLSALLLSGAWRRPLHELRQLRAAGRDWAAATSSLASAAAALLASPPAPSSPHFSSPSQRSAMRGADSSNDR